MKNTVPFKIRLRRNRLARCYGLIRDEDDHLCLEFQLVDRVFGLLKSGIRQVRIPLGELVSVELKKGWLGMRTWLVIQVSCLETVRDVPGAGQGRLALRVAGKDLEAATRFVADLHVPDLS